MGILLPAKTPSNCTTRSRNENGWHYIASTQCEKLSTFKKKVNNSGLSVNDVLKADAEKEKRRQIERAKAKKITTTTSSTSGAAGAPRPGMQRAS